MGFWGNGDIVAVAGNAVGHNVPQTEDDYSYDDKVNRFKPDKYEDVEA